MAHNDADSEYEGSDRIRSALMDFTTNFFKNKLSAQFDTGSVMSGLTDGFEKMRETAKATAAAKTAIPRTFADMLATSVPNTADIAAFYKHIATANLSNCDDILEGYAADEHPHALLLAIKPSVNSDDL